MAPTVFYHIDFREVSKNKSQQKVSKEYGHHVAPHMHDIAFSLTE